MKRIITCAIGLTVAAIMAIPSATSAKDFYKMSSIAAGTTVYSFQTTFVKIMAANIKDVEIQISAAGKATRHNLEAANYKIDFYMSSPAVYDLMSKKKAMYSKLENAPALAKNLRNLFNYPFGSWHIVTFADSGIKELKDVKGKRIYLGAPGGAAFRAAKAIVEGVTGYTAGKEFEFIKLGFGPARQAFQDRQTALHIEPTAAPAPAFQQIALTNKIRLIGLKDADWKIPGVKAQIAAPGRGVGVIPKDAYGKNQVNTEDVQALSTTVGLGTHNKMPADLIYKMTKAFWENLETVHKTAPWMKNITLKNAFVEGGMPLHKGAAKYYREIGLKIPDSIKPVD